jgi:hypothetical protein
MTSIQPQFQVARGHRSADVEQVPVSVEGRAKMLEDFLELEDNLHGDPHFGRVEPERTELEDTTGEIVFRLHFLYDPREQAEAPEAGPAAAAPGGSEAAPAPEAGSGAGDGNAPDAAAGDRPAEADADADADAGIPGEE